MTSLDTLPLTRFEIAGLSHVGRVREINEDSWGQLETKVGPFVVVADGMGGHRTGEIASHLAVEALLQTMAGGNLRPPQLLAQAFEQANAAVHNQANARLENRGMGTTATALLLDGPNAIVGHVGDSRIYLYRAGVLKQLSRDHSWVAERVRAGELDPFEARSHRWRNVITNALGAFAKTRLDLFAVIVQPGDQILVCSDGLTNVLCDEELSETLDENRQRTAQAVAQTLVDAANNGGGPDNITAVLVRINGILPASGNYPLPVLQEERSTNATPELDPRQTYVLEPSAPKSPATPFWLIALVLVLYVAIFVAVVALR